MIGALHTLAATVSLLSAGVGIPNRREPDPDAPLCKTCAAPMVATKGLPDDEYVVYICGDVFCGVGGFW